MALWAGLVSHNPQLPGTVQADSQNGFVTALGLMRYRPATAYVRLLPIRIRGGISREVAIQVLATSSGF